MFLILYQSQIFNLKNQNICYRCNLIIITFDSLRYDHTNLANYSKNTTPNLEKFSKGAWVFSNDISTSASTLFALSSMFTSKYPFTNGLIKSVDIGNESINGFYSSDITLAEILQSSNYTTAAFVGNFPASSLFGLSKGFQNFDDDFITKIPPRKTSDELTSEAIDWLTNHVQKEEQQPFFLWIHYFEPHCPYIYKKTYQELNNTQIYITNSTETPEYLRCGDYVNLTGFQVANELVRYDMSIRYADENLGKLLDTIDQYKLDKNTVIIITSDHAESLGEHQIIDHNYLYLGVLKVPLIMKIPNFYGHFVNSPISAIDILPTALKIFDIKTNITERGIDIFSSQRNLQFSEESNASTIISGDMKLIKRNFQYSMFNISNDPNETNDISSSNADEFTQLKMILENITSNSLQANSDQKNITTPNIDILQKLKSLGYVQ